MMQKREKGNDLVEIFSDKYKIVDGTGNVWNAVENYPIIVPKIFADLVKETSDLLDLGFLERFGV